MEKPCIIVKCEELEDQFECDAYRTPVKYLKSTKELESQNFDFMYEVYTINELGDIEFNEELSTYG
jgi:hypothetical protein